MNTERITLEHAEHEPIHGLTIDIDGEKCVIIDANTIRPLSALRAEGWDEPAERPAEQGARYPHITVQLTGEDGNAFAIIAAVTRALRRNGVKQSECDAFRDEAMSGDYDNVIQTAMRWVEVE